MNEDLKYFWDIPGNVKYLSGPPVTDQLVSYAESQWGVVLPKIYVELIKIQNGGYTIKTLPESVQSQIWGIPAIDGDFKGRTLFDIFEQVSDPETFRESADTRHVITLDGDGHWYLCMDYRKTGRNGDPEIVWIEVESGYEESHVIAPNFEEFLNLLIYDNVFAYLFLTAETPKNVVERLSHEYGFDFDFHNYGYDYWSIKNFKRGPSIESNSAHTISEDDEHDDGPPTTRAWGEKRARYNQIPESGSAISWMDEEDSHFSIEKIKSLFPDLITLHIGKD